MTRITLYASLLPPVTLIVVLDRLIERYEFGRESLNGSVLVDSDSYDITAKVNGDALTSRERRLSLEASSLKDVDISVEEPFGLVVVTDSENIGLGVTLHSFDHLLGLVAD